MMGSCNFQGIRGAHELFNKIRDSGIRVCVGGLLSQNGPTYS